MLVAVYYQANCYAPELIARTLSDDARLTSVWRLFVAYIGPRSRTERPRKTKIGTEVILTHDSNTTFKFKWSKVKVTGGGGHIVAASRLQLLFNVTKSECLIVKSRNDIISCPTFRICGAPASLPYTDSYNYLGHIINSDLTDDADMTWWGRPERFMPGPIL